MDIVYKVLIAFLCIVLMVSSGLAFTISSAAEVETNNYFEAVAQIVADSNYSEAVMNRLVEQAADNGHELIIEIHGEKKPGVNRYAEITLKYKYKIPLFGISMDRVKCKAV